MSKLLFENAAGLLVTVLVLTPGVLWGAGGQQMGGQAGPRELIKTVESKYTLSQMGKQIGSETVTRSDYNDNSVVYNSVLSMSPADGINITVRTELLLEADSFFPVRYVVKKEVEQGDNKHAEETTVDMYSNVAVTTIRMGEREDTTRYVLPTGTGFMDSNASFHFYPLLFWYDENLGGRQTFDVFDPKIKRPESVVFLAATTENVAVNGEEIPAVLYILEKEKRKPAKVYVEKNGLIVKIEDNFLVFELTGWSEHSAGPK